VKGETSVMPVAMLWTIPVAGVIGLVTLLLRGGDFSVVAMTSPDKFLVYQYLLIAAYVLPFPGFIALWLQCRTSDRPGTLSFLGLLGLIWGTSLALPALGIASFMMPAAVDLGSASVTNAAVQGALMGPGLPLGIVAATLYTLGPILLGVALWKTGDNSRIAVALFVAHGALLSFGFSFFPLLILGWAMLSVSGSLFAIRYKSSG